MKYLVYIPNYCVEEQKYIIEIFFNNYIDCSFEILIHNKNFIKICNDDSNLEKSIIIPTDFFKISSSGWLAHSMLPKCPLKYWSIKEDKILKSTIESNIPILYGSSGYELSEKIININFDLFGSSFFLITRCEEFIIKKRDKHNRFSAYDSVAYNNGFLNRPIVNEYFEILLQLFLYHWPKLKKLKRKSRLLISCDVDHPFDLASKSVKKTILRFFARLIRDRSLKQGFVDLLNYFFTIFNVEKFDSYRRNIDWMIKVSGKNIISFNFITFTSNKLYDQNLDIFESRNNLMFNKIINSGHLVGMHPGYDTYNNPVNFKKTLSKFKYICNLHNVDFKTLGGRQHYLRYDIIETPLLWNDSSLSYDSSLGYPEEPGYRCSFANEFHMYDLNNRCKLDIKQRPLVIMESTILSTHKDIKKNYSKVLKEFDYYKNVSEILNTDLTILWHNSYFFKKIHKDVYLHVVK